MTIICEEQMTAIAGGRIKQIPKPWKSLKTLLKRGPGFKSRPGSEASPTLPVRLKGEEPVNTIHWFWRDFTERINL